MSVRCKRLPNHCPLTVNTFSSGAKFVSGNQCDKGAGIKHDPADELPDLHEYKRQKLAALAKVAAMTAAARRLVCRLPSVCTSLHLCGMQFFRRLGFGCILTGQSTKEMYAKGHILYPLGHRVLSRKADARSCADSARVWALTQYSIRVLHTTWTKNAA